jgi:hypothetical protein
MSQLNEIIKQITLRRTVSSIGGLIEISLDVFGYKTHRMVVGGRYKSDGIMEIVICDCTVTNWKNDSELINLAEELKTHCTNLTPDNGYEKLKAVLKEMSKFEEIV